jgi:hypothetical protein
MREDCGLLISSLWTQIVCNKIAGFCYLGYDNHLEYLTYII